MLSKKYNFSFIVDMFKTTCAGVNVSVLYAPSMLAQAA